MGGRLSAYVFFGVFFVVWVGRVFLLPVDAAIENPVWKQLWVQGLRFGFWVLPVVLWLRLRERAPVLHSLGLDVVPRGRVLVKCVLIVAGYFGLTACFGLVTGVNSLERLLSHSGSAWVVLLTLTPLAPIAEEVLFRGFLLPWLARERSGAIANLVQAAMFTATHIPGWLYLRGPSLPVLHDLAGVFLIGLVLGYLFLLSRSLWPPIVLHTLNNLWMGATG